MENAFKSGSLCHVIKPDKRVRNDYCERSKIDEIYIQWIWKKDKNCPSYCFGLNWRQNVKIAWFWNSLAVLLSNRISFKHTGVFGQTFIIHRLTLFLKYLCQGSTKLHSCSFQKSPAEHDQSPNLQIGLCTKLFQHYIYCRLCKIGFQMM